MKILAGGQFQKRKPTSYAENNIHVGARYGPRPATAGTSILPMRDTSKYVCRTKFHFFAALSISEWENLNFAARDY